MSREHDKDPERALRVMLVDGSTDVRHAIARTVEGEPSLYFVGSAINARTANAKLPSYRPDVVLVDCETPDLTGAAIARSLVTKDESPAVVPMLRDGVLADAWLANERLEGLRTITRAQAARGDGERLAALLRQAASEHRERGDAADDPTANATAAPATSTPPTMRPRSGADAGDRDPRVVAIGSSTGGPDALAKLLPRLSGDFPLPILIVQHMPPKFTASLATSLNNACQLTVQEARGGQLLRPGNVYIAPGGHHLGLCTGAEGVATRLSQAAPEHSCRPAVDFLLRSVADAYGGHVIGVMLTGMGCDGLAGFRQLHALGARLFAQDEASCTVYGMPRGPVEEGLAEAVPLTDIAARIERAARQEQLR